MHPPSLIAAFFFLLLNSHFSSSAPLANVSYLIDCGRATGFSDQFNRTWLPDRYFSGGSAAIVKDPQSYPQLQERTLRYFSPTSSGKKSCYSVPVPPGRYYIRLFTVYGNYDGDARTPSFDVSVEGTPVFSLRSPWPEKAAKSGAYSDLIVPVSDSAADVCFYSIATDAAVVGSLEVIAVDSQAYDAPFITSSGQAALLVSYGRVTCGSGLFGPGFTDADGGDDPFDRAWKPDTLFRGPVPKFLRVISTDREIRGAGRPPNYFPQLLYRSAVTSLENATIEYLFPVDTTLDYLVWLHFAEIDPAVTAAGRRVFDVLIDRKNLSRVDVFGKAGGFTAFEVRHVVGNVTATPLRVELVPVVGTPLVSGIECYALVPLGRATVPAQVAAMKALKESLKVPERMGWNGDPCAPSSWDAWEGVTCQLSDDGVRLVISQLDLGSQGLKGYISGEISLLTDLVSLNLSSNSIEGTLSPNISLRSLVNLDLSENQLSGSIPEILGLGSPNLQIVLLNNNQFEGQVPEKLYSVGVHGGEIDLSHNKGLCGVPSLPSCSLFWENGSLRMEGKIAIGISCGILLLVASVTAYLYRLKRRKLDYNFTFAHDLTSLAAKRNRYHRQKSLILMEMQTPRAKGTHILNPL